MSEEEAFGMFWWYNVLEEEEKKHKKNLCPKCGSEKVHYDDLKEVWVCLDCGYEWDDS